MDSGSASHSRLKGPDESIDDLNVRNRRSPARNDIAKGETFPFLCLDIDDSTRE